MLLGAVAQAQNFAITATTEAAIRKNIVKGNAANYGFGMINDTLKLVGLTTRNVIFTGSTSKTDIGLGNVDNTSDLNKPVSTATQTALNLKANIASPTFTGTVGGITKSMVGLGNVDNTTDAGKPISTATQTALDLKLTSTTAASTYLPISNPTATGTLTAPTIANTLGANFATSSGNVGIGTTAPSAKLELYGAGAIAQKITSSNNVAQIITSGTLGQIYNASGDFYLTNLSSTAQIRLQTNGTDRLNIFSNGRVGIGTTTDEGYLLNVNGTANITGMANLGSTYVLNNTINVANVNDIDGNELYLNYFGYNAGNTRFRNTVIGNGKGIPVIYIIGSSGNVNIGRGNNFDSGYKLDVLGTIQSSQFKLNALNTAPENSSATGATGEIKVDANFIYICTATNTWKRSAITTW